MVQDAGVGQVAREADQPLLARRSRVSWLRRLGRLARQKPLGTIAVVILAVMWLSAIFAPIVAPFYWRDVFSGPRLQAPDSFYWFGTDDVGRDVFSRIVWGGR